MINLFIIIFIFSLVYLAAAGRLLTYTKILYIQGFLLTIIGLIELKELNIANLIFIIVETLVFKALVVPYFFSTLIKRNHLENEREADKPHFFAIFKVSIIIIVSYTFAYSLNDEHLEITYFTASIAAILTGLLMIVKRKKIITHVMGYLVIENGIFLLSMALGSELPLIVNLGILLDLFTSVLLFGMFVTKIGQLYQSTEIENLTELKD